VEGQVEIREDVGVGVREVKAEDRLGVSDSMYVCSIWWDSIVKMISVGRVGRVGDGIVVRVLISGMLSSSVFKDKVRRAECTSRWVAESRDGRSGWSFIYLEICIR